MSEPTRRQIRTFIRIRNESGLNSNLQFQFDASEAGFSTDDLPKAEKFEEGIYLWPLSYGLLVECYGRLMLSDAPYDKGNVVGTAKRLAG